MDRRSTGSDNEPFFTVSSSSTPLPSSTAKFNSTFPQSNFRAGERSDFDFGGDDILPNYDFQPIRRSGSMNSRLSSTPWLEEGSINRRHRSSSLADHGVGSTVYLTGKQLSSPRKELDMDSYHSVVVSAVEHTMKKYADSILRVLEGMTGRLSQLEASTDALEHSVAALKLSVADNHGETDGRLRMLNNHVEEVHRAVQILRDKQEIAKAHAELAKLQLPKIEAPIRNSNSGSAVNQTADATTQVQVSTQQQLPLCLTLTTPQATYSSQLQAPVFHQQAAIAQIEPAVQSQPSLPPSYNTEMQPYFPMHAQVQQQQPQQVQLQQHSVVQQPLLPHPEMQQSSAQQTLPQHMQAQQPMQQQAQGQHSVPQQGSMQPLQQQAQIQLLPQQAPSTQPQLQQAQVQAMPQQAQIQQPLPQQQQPQQLQLQHQSVVQQPLPPHQMQQPLAQQTQVHQALPQHMQAQQTIQQQAQVQQSLPQQGPMQPLQQQAHIQLLPQQAPSSQPQLQQAQVQAMPQQAQIQQPLPQQQQPQQLQLQQQSVVQQPLPSHSQMQQSLAQQTQVQQALPQHMQAQQTMQQQAQGQQLLPQQGPMQPLQQHAQIQLLPQQAPSTQPQLQQAQIQQPLPQQPQGQHLSQQVPHAQHPIPTQLTVQSQSTQEATLAHVSLQPPAIQQSPQVQLDPSAQSQIQQTPPHQGSFQQYTHQHESQPYAPLPQSSLVQAPSLPCGYAVESSPYGSANFGASQQHLSPSGLIPPQQHAQLAPQIYSSSHQRNNPSRFPLPSTQPPYESNLVPPSGDYSGPIYRVGQPSTTLPSAYPRLPAAQPVSSGPSSGGGNPSVNRLPLDGVVEKVVAMGFSREQVRSVIRRLTENGQSVDMNVVLDTLMNGGKEDQPQRVWHGR